MAQTPMSLNNDPEGHFSYLTLLTHLLANIANINFDVCTRIREHTLPVRLWPWMSLKVIHQFQGFSNASQLKSSTFVQQFTRFQLALPRRAIPQRQPGFLLYILCVFLFFSLVFLCDKWSSYQFEIFNRPIFTWQRNSMATCILDLLCYCC